MKSEIEQLGMLIDKASSAGEIEACIKQGDEIKSTLLGSDDDAAVLYYYLGNAWANLDSMRFQGKMSDLDFDRNELSNAIKYFRQCLSMSADSAGFRETRVRAHVNIGNLFSDSGRIIFAIESWKKALDLSPQFGMAGCNLSQGLVSYALMLYNQGHSALICRKAYKLCLYYIDCPSVQPGSRKQFRETIDQLEDSFNSSFLRSEESFDEYTLGRTLAERRYRSWVAENSLFLNPMNDIFSESIVSHDIVGLPDMTVMTDSPLVFHGFYNQIKQEYISARYLYFQYLEELPDQGHFSDLHRSLVDTFDYDLHGLRWETLKNTFRMLYSIFDKVAYFLNEYFSLERPQDRVSFRTMWFVTEKSKGNQGSKKKINPLLSMSNKPLRALYMLSKDFGSTDNEYLSSINPDARDLAETRNYIEHRHFRIQLIESHRSTESARPGSYVFSVGELRMRNRTLILMRAAREALIYLSLSVHAEEQRRSERAGFPIICRSLD